MAETENISKFIINGTQIKKMEKTIGEQILSATRLIGDILILLCQVVYSILESIFRLFVKPELKPVRDEIVLITGTGHGIGRELALLYAAEGATVVGWDVNAKNNDETMREIKELGYRKAFSYQCDVSNRADVLATAQRVQQEVGDVTVLINNAGIMPTHELLDHTEDEIQRIIGINVLAHFWTLQAFLPAMRQANRGHIVALSSCAGIMGLTNLVPYCASKFAVRGLMEALHEEMNERADNGVRFTTIFPYMVDTGLCKRPKIRFPALMPLLKPKRVAEYIMEAQRTNTLEMTLPPYILQVHNVIRTMPIRAGIRLKRFMDSGVESDLA